MPLHHCVYVIQLAPEVLYVGSTGNTPEERLAVHQSGGKRSARVCRRHVARGALLMLRPDLLPERHNKLTFAEAQQLESKLASDLQAKGFAVYGGH